MNLHVFLLEKGFNGILWILKRTNLRYNFDILSSCFELLLSPLGQLSERE